MSRLVAALAGVVAVIALAALVIVAALAGRTSSGQHGTLVIERGTVPGVALWAQDVQLPREDWTDVGTVDGHPHCQQVTLNPTAGLFRCAGGWVALVSLTPS